MAKRTALFAQHQLAGGHLVEFAGFEMPMHYGSQIQEHLAVRQQVGMFDVSHMGVLEIEGPEASAFLRYALANDVNKLSTNQALYTCLLNEQGGIIDDLIVYRLADNQYRIVQNASRIEVDTAWLKTLSASFQVTLSPQTQLGILAVQGPKALETVVQVLGNDYAKIAHLKPFTVYQTNDLFIARTGYTGEIGVEILVPNTRIVSLWQQLLEAGVKPCGLGARDTLRLEAGFNLYGVDMTETTSPYVSNLAWTVCLKDEARDFIGKSALIAEKSRGVSQQLVGVVMKSRGVLRNHQPLYFKNGVVGEITSGSFSPTLNYSIALARIPVDIHAQAYIERRGESIEVEITKPRFIEIH